jgi:uncharacterized protein (TIGR03435 family)
MTGNDMDLVREYATRQSEQAFATLASRHVNLIYSTALRQAGDASLAEEITQAVFIILARKAGSLGPKTILPSWLYRTTCYAAKDALRTQRRRQRREQEAYMQSTIQEANTDAAWEQLSPLLDDAITRLGRSDRDALVLRFFENKSLQEIGAAIGTSEDAAKKRVHRALEKLRRYFFKRGVVVPAAVLTTAISANSVHAAPVMLATTATGLALAQSGAGPLTLAIVKGTSKLMAWAKAKTAMLIAGSMLAAAATTGFVTELKNNPSSPDEVYEKIWACLQAPDPDTDRIAALFKAAPAALIIRPTHYTNCAGGAWDMDTHKSCAVNMHIRQLLNIAYDNCWQRLIFPVEAPAGYFDFMATLPAGKNAAALQEEIKTRFGLIAHKETRETDVLVLKVKTPGQLQSYLSRKSGNGFNGYAPDRSNGITFRFRNVQLREFAKGLEGLLEKPVVDHSELTNQYNLDLQLDPTLPAERLRQSIRGQVLQLGLELKSGHEAVEMLVVENVK